MGMGFIIRQMKKRDIAQVQQVAIESWHATYDGIIPLAVQDRFLDGAYNDKSMKHRLKSSVLFVAEMDRRIVGFANFSNVDQRGKVELGALYLYPEYQGEGIGTALLQEGIKQLEGVREIYLHVEKQNRIGARFYEAKGFEVVDEFADEFDGHTLQTVRMVLHVKQRSRV